MKQLDKTIVIHYRWWRDCDGDDSIKPEHVEALEERAMDRIKEMMEEGYSSGELLDNIRMSDEDGEDGIEYTGWWHIEEWDVMENKS